jgi:hypothetical protein
LEEPLHKRGHELILCCHQNYDGQRKKNTLFWDAPWLIFLKPKDITPLVYMISTRNKWNAKSALHENGWVEKNQDAHVPCF